MLKIHAPAKVNLLLHVLEREESGFHRLETVFAALEFGDTVSLSSASSGVSVDTGGAELGPPAENLAYRAAEGFLERSGIGGGVKIRLDKRIPVGGGLGGGSSDAAATLRGLQILFPGRLSGEELGELARSLGSDVPFFLSASPFALGRGRGDRVLPLPPLPSAPVVLAIPPVSVPTGAAYGRLARAREGEAPPAHGRQISPDAVSTWDRIAAVAWNDFEEVILPDFPPLARLRHGLQATAPLFALLSGSGSTVFAVYSDEVQASSGKAVLEETFPDNQFVLTRTLVEVPDPLGDTGVDP